MKKRVLPALLVLVLCLTLLPSALAVEDVSYIDASGEEATATNVLPLTSDQTSLGDDSGACTWYVASGTVSFNSYALNVSGDANIILCDDADLDISSLLFKNDATVNIFGQTNGTGTLWFGSISNSFFSNNTISFADATLRLYGGTFFALPTENVTPTLAPGRCYRTGTPGSYSYSTTLPADYDSFTVVPCPHTTVQDGICTACGGVSYRAYDETSGEFVNKTLYAGDYASIVSSTASYSDTWLVVKEDTTIDGTLKFTNLANLILCDGATLTVNGGLRAKGLTIYGQSQGTGKLTATGGAGGYDNSFCSYGVWADGPLTIHGGQITTDLSDQTTAGYSFGMYSTNTITINGGAVTATGGKVGGSSHCTSAGIKTFDTLAVNGGTLTATGGPADLTSGQTDITSVGLSVGYLTVSGGSITVSATEIDVSACYPLQVNDSCTVSGGTLKLPVGSYAKQLAVQDPVTFADLLSSGCAYQDNNGDLVNLTENAASSLSNVTVVPHEEHDYGEDGKCVYCGKAKPSDSSYSIKVLAAENGAVKASATKSPKGKTITLTVTPDEGYELDSLTVLTTKDREIDLIDNGDGTYSFTMPRSAVTVEAVFTATEVTPAPEPEPEPTPTPSFSDVPSDSWFAPAVSWAVENGITTGTSATTFAPSLPCTRAELVTFLWRAAGSPEAGSSSPFEDTPSDAFYAPALAWAVEQNLVKGSGNNLFCPEKVISREETATILYRYAQSQNNGFSGSWAFRMPFDDIEEISDWAWEAVCWCYKEGILEGFGNKLTPKADCSRAQIVTMLSRFLEK